MDQSKRILLVDDDPTIRTLVTRVFQSDYEVRAVANGEEALDMAPHFRPHVVLLDIMMPGIDGYTTCRRMRDNSTLTGTLIVIVSANSTSEEQLRAYEEGADDYITKPFDPHELLARVRLHFRLLDAVATIDEVSSEIEKHKTETQKLVEHQQREVVAAQDVTMFTLARVAECRDQETGSHLIRMRDYSQILAEHLSKKGPYVDQIDQTFLENLYRSSPLHDVGKVAVSDTILLKKGPLTPEERRQMQRHTVIGGQILEETVRQFPGGHFLAMAATVARHHHERFDGKGYPAGLTGQRIPLAARIVSVADVFDALTSVRPYKRAFSPYDSREIIVAESGGQFDPVVVEAFEECFGRFLEIQAVYAGTSVLDPLDTSLTNDFK